MSSHVVVIATDLRRATVKVNPGTYLVDVLEDACRKLGLRSNGYLLKHKQRQVDLSVPFRAAGLVGGAKLELIVKSLTPSAVSVALQLPSGPESASVPGGRLVDKFPSDWPVWKLLRQFESGPTATSNGTKLNLTARAVAQTTSGTGASGNGQLFWETPVLNILGRELATIPDLQKTLSQLGCNSGNVLIRLSFRETDKTLVQAMEEISRCFKEDEEDAGHGKAKEPEREQKGEQQEESTMQARSEARHDAKPTKGHASQLNEQQMSEPVAPGTDTTDQPTTQPQATNIDTPAPFPANGPLRPESVFSAPTSATPRAVRTRDSDAAFIPSVAQAKLHQAHLQTKFQNRRLLSDQELGEQAAQEAARIAAIPSVAIRVRFPDNTMAQWRFAPEDTGATLHKAVRGVMAAEGQPFHLVLPGDKRAAIRDAEKLPGDSLIRGYKLSGGVLVNLVWGDAVPAEVRKSQFLKQSVQDTAQQISIPEVQDVGGDENDEEKEESANVSAQEKKGSGGGGEGKKLPKWLKLGKK